MNIKNLEDALMKFEENTLKQEACNFEKGNARKYNQFSNNIASVAKWLYKNELLSELKIFYNHNSINTRSWAASFLLEIDTNNAIKILEELVLLNDFNSKYILLEWKAGILNMSFFKE